MKLQKISKFFSLSFRQQSVFFEAVVLLLFAKAIIISIPFRKIAPYLGVLNGDTRILLTLPETKKSDDVRLGILMTSANVPWKSVYLDQAIAASIMLKNRRIPHQLCMGVKKNEHQEKLDAHAWIICGDSILLGGQKSRYFSVTAKYTRNFEA